jgi:hypothetical protein
LIFDFRRLAALRRPNDDRSSLGSPSGKLNSQFSGRYNLGQFVMPAYQASLGMALERVTALNAALGKRASSNAIAPGG